MGLFDNIKKKNEAKNLGLTVEQYDGFLSAKVQGITIDEYKRYLSSFSGKYSLEQFSTLLKLEKKGFNSQECERYLSSLAVKIQVDDYADFLEAEKIGLTVEQYAVYASSLKTKMSAVDYTGFLKAQKIGITLGKYLHYLKSFKDEMSIEEYDTYLKAEDNGMDREHYAEYLEKYKDTYTIERYLEFDKARSLGMTLEEYDLRMEASKYGMSVEKYQAHKDAEKLQMTDEEYEIYKKSGISESIADGVLTIPNKLTELPKNVFKHFEFTSVVFPETLTKIANGAFEDCKQLSSVVIPSRIKKIGDEAFKGCELLEDVTIENGVEEVGDSAFEGCKKLKELYIPGSVKDFENHAVYGCDSLEKLEFEYGVESIDVSEWTELANLKTVITPATASIKLFPTYRKNDTTYRIINSDYKFSMNSEAKIDYITPAEYSEYGLDGNKDEIEYLEVRGDYVFLDLSGFAKLKVVDFSAKGSIRSVKNCPSLQMIIYKSYMSGVPSGYASNDREREEKIIEMKTLAMNHFDVPSLRFLAVDNGAMVVDLDDYSASDLAWVHVPACTSRLGLNTPSVSAVAVHGNCKISSDTLVGAENISKVRFDKDGRENGVYSNASARSILSAEFASADLIELRIDRTEFTAETLGVQRHVRHISLPDGLIRIGDNAFEAWGLENITIPASLEKLGDNAFMDCKQLKSVVFEGTPKTVGCDVFDNCSSLESITIGGRILSADEFADQYEIKGAAPVVKPEVTTAFEKMTEEDNTQDDEPIMVVSQQPEVEIENDDSVAVNVAGQFSMRLPSNFVYSTDAAVIGKNRVLIAMLDDETADFGRPYSATESITVLIGKAVASSDDADTVAASIGVKNGNVLQDIPGLNVRYAVKEAGESQSIYLALICTNSNSYPTQIFFNNATDVDAEQIVAGLLKSVEIKAESVAETREEQKESSERVDLVEEKIAAMVDRSVSTDVPAGVLYQPGFEPEKIKVRLDRLFEKLDSAYPDKVIVGLNKNHKHWGETVTELYRLLGYSDNNSFLNAYGYITGTGVSGRPANDPMEVVNELKRRYADGATCTKMAELAAENPDLAPKFKYLQNQADKFFGMTLQKCFVQEGILVKKTDDQCGDAFEALKSRYADAPYTGKMNDLKAENADIDWNAINRYYAQSGSADTLKAFLVKEGIMEETKSVEAKLAAVTDTLKERYASGKKKAYTITDLRGQNLDLPISSIGTWSKKVFGQNATEYLHKQGILSGYDGMEYSRIENKRIEAAETAREETSAAEMAAPVEEKNYEPQTYYVDEIDISGKEVSDWKVTDSVWDSKNNCWNHEGEIYIKDYHGPKDHIILPVSINGKRISGIDSFAFEKSMATVMEIPGAYGSVAEHMCFQNKALRTVIIGEGITEIGDDAFFNVPELEEVYISQSVEMVHGDSAFSATKWYNKQGDNIILGSVFAKYRGKDNVLNIPHGIKTIAQHVFENAYYSRKGIRKVIIPDTVTTICDAAFWGSGYENIQKFIFTDSIQNIGFNAFGDNKWTKSFGNNPIIINNQLYQVNETGPSIVIPEGVTKICDGVFRWKSKLQSVNFPSTLKEIGEHAFVECENLTSIELPEGIERLGTKCFSCCKKLTKFNIPDSLIEIGKSAFNDCTGLTEVELGESVEIIGEKAFMDCSMLRSFRMNKRVKAILAEAFKKCTALEAIELPDSLTEIGKEAFSECTSLDHVVIPRGVAKINSSAFSNCKSLKSIQMHEGITEIAGSAFENCTGLTEMVLPAVVGQRAFSGCTALEKVTFTPGMTKIDKNVLYGCTALTEITIPEGVEVIDESAFYGCVALKAVTLPSTLKKIGKSAFRGCTSLHSVCIPNAVSTIGDNAFEGCTALAEVVMANGVSNLGVDVFTNTPYMKNAFGEFVVIGGALLKYLGEKKDVVIPDNVSTIEKNAFAEAYHVKSITIPDTVKTIADMVIGNVNIWEDVPKPQLKKLVIGNGVTSIGKQAFYKCEALTDVSFGSSLSTIGQEAFGECKNLTAIDLSKTAITAIDQAAFSGCEKAKKLTLPETIEIIGRSAFSGNPLGIVKLPKSVKRVERSAFNGASELIVYDSIDPDAAWAYEWKYDQWNGSVNSPLACAMLGVPQNYLECQGNTSWRDYHITVLSADTDEIRYRIFCDSKEKDAYRAMMFSAWGKHASFTFDDYDEHFMKTHSQLGRTEMAFCRIQYPEGVNAVHRANYEAFLERCLYIERSAKRTAEMIANDDNVERLQLLDGFHAIDEHNIAWIREQMEKKKAVKCIAYLDERYSK